MRYDALDWVGGDVEFFKRQTLFQFDGKLGERVVRDIEDDKGRSEDSKEGGEEIDKTVSACR